MSDRVVTAALYTSASTLACLSGSNISCTSLADPGNSFNSLQASCDLTHGKNKEGEGRRKKNKAGEGRREKNKAGEGRREMNKARGEEGNEQSRRGEEGKEQSGRGEEREWKEGEWWYSD